MTEEYNTAPESPKSLEQLAIDLAGLDPKPVTNFTPDNLDQVLEDFLNGDARNVDSATYSSLDQVDFESKISEYKQILGEILENPLIPANHQHAYIDYVNRNLQILELMKQAHDFRLADNPSDRADSASRFDQINKELYGELDPKIASSMVQEVLSDSADIADPQIQKIRAEFIQLLPENLLQSGDLPQLSPSPEAKQVVDRCIEHIYGSILEHADQIIEQIALEKSVEGPSLRLDPEDMVRVFQSVIDEFFADSGWAALIASANVVTVDVVSKQVKVPPQRKPVSAEKMRGLVVHELGVHMLRSIMGEKADLIPMQFGMAGSGDAEEGLATIFEGAVTGDEARTGYQHYLTASLIQGGMDFRDAHEIMWRYKALDDYLDKPKEVNDKFVDKNKTTAAKFMFRTVRGTNQLAWLTNLSYFNGKHKMWNYIEQHKDDFNLVVFLFMGKSDPTNPDHMRAVLDAKSKAVV